MVRHISPFKDHLSDYGENIATCMPQVVRSLCFLLKMSVGFRLFSPFLKSLDARFAFEYRQTFHDSHVLTHY